MFNLKYKDDLYKFILSIFVLSVISVFLIAVTVILFYSYPAIIRYGFPFLWVKEWNPPKEVFGALTFLAGTFMVTFLALLFAIPFSFGIGIFLQEYCPLFLRGIFTVIIEMLAGIPSVVFGVWGVLTIVPWLRESVEPFFDRHFSSIPFLKVEENIGYGILAASIVVAFMILPIISSITKDSLASVPKIAKDGALAMGATRLDVIKDVSLPYALNGIYGGIILGFGRAVGETIAVVLLIGNQAIVPKSLFSVGYTISAVLANTFTFAVISPIYASAEVELALILLAVSLIVNIVGRNILNKVIGGRFNRSQFGGG
ncbi:MAG: phosphate ABC transporter permease subunit PstC [Candidatus Acidulodesulfobacterium ferriphilum]|uniref:Phosphate transport system permease protein n=1 Tax=Candidatus Acidulodesulfobacterium ferriphilum TaxID=2597223 RepID=A0A519BAY5_9DELT|nr:MAG: phosphate ABC transporter permease subunit PstC [Candidatus Acidulodesulfobacterium ferriphilum]